MSHLFHLLKTLVAFNSITPKDEGCQVFMRQHLESLGFECLVLDNMPVSNFFAVFGHSGPLLVFAGHTDVVPVGDMTHWQTDPFVLTAKDDRLFGRGVADMKGSLAAMLMMAQKWVSLYPQGSGRLGFLITSGEEGDDFHMVTPYVMEQLQNRGIAIDYCVVGEPSSSHTVGDVIKIGRRGSLTAKIRVQGKQGHVAYPHLAENPIHRISSALNELCSKQWDQGNPWFPPTTLQMTAIHADANAGNLIPGELKLQFNFRFSTEHSAESLKEAVLQILGKEQLNFTIDWRLNGSPFLTNKGALLDAAKQAISEHTGLGTELSTSGGTSDGRFIAPYGVEVVEIGPVNASIHQVNEWVSLKELHSLEKIYFSICEKLLT